MPMMDYSEIAKVLRDEIRAGVYSGSGAFPSLTKIVQRFGVSRPSAVRSIVELKRLGLVTVRKGSGTFVSKVNRTIGLAIPGTADSEFFSAVMDGLVYNCNKYGMDLVAGDFKAHGRSFACGNCSKLRAGNASGWHLQNFEEKASRTDVAVSCEAF